MSDDGPRRPSYQARPAARSSGPGERAYRASVRLFSAILLALGGVLLTVTVAEGGGPLSVGTLMGVALLAVGAMRLWLASRMSR